MFIENICNYRLRRTLPKLSGNMQLDLIVASDSGKPASGRASNKIFVQQAHLRPISPLIPYVPIIDERLMDRPHHLNIKDFYKKTISGFFSSPIDPNLKTDWPWMVSYPEMENLKYLKNWDDTYWAGTKRMAYKLYGTTHECLVPVWLDQCYGLRFILKFMGDTSELTSYVLDVSQYYQSQPKEAKHKFHNDFVNYLMDYLDYINVVKGNIDVMSIDFKHNLCTVTGLQPESGNIVVRKNYNVSRNLMFRERPLLEANSLITNTFPDMKLICPHLINFNICFDLESILNDDVKNIVSGVPNLQVKVEVQALRKYEDLKFNNAEHEDADEWIWETLEVRDFYTNHDYIPRPKAQVDYKDGQGSSYTDFSESDHINALEYKKDYLDLSMMHQNKMVQPICHWVHATKPDGDLFNLYDGFGAYIKDKNGNITEWNHGFGTTIDPADTEYDRGLDNTIWAGPPRIGDGDEIENTLNAAQRWIDDGYFKDASNFINGLKFDYDPDKIDYPNTPTRTAPRKVYIGTMTTPWATNAQEWKTMATSLVTSQSYINILTQRVSSSAGQDLPKNILERNKGTFDEKYDYHKYSDADNRWHVTTSKGNNALYIDPTGEKIPLGDYAVYSETRNGKIYGKVANKGADIELAYPIIRIGGEYPMNTNLREHDNTTSLCVAMRRVTGPDKMGRPDDPLCIIFWHGRAMKEEDACTSDGVIFEDLPPCGLTLGGVIEAVTNYFKKYGPMWEALQKAVDRGDIDELPPGLPDMDDFKVVVNVMNTIQMPDVIYFNKSITGRPNMAISTKAKETDYFKLPNVNEYVWRYSNKIKPAILKCQLIERENKGAGVPVWSDGFGRNFVYNKKMIWPYTGCFPSGLSAYINTGVPPKYPSLGYETIEAMTITAPKNKSVPRGDIMYDEPHPCFFGTTLNGINMDLLDIKFGVVGQVVDNIAADATYAARFGLTQSEALKDQIGDLPLIGNYNKLDKNDKNLIDNYLISNNLYQYFINHDSYDTWGWFEYKWFDKSTVTSMPYEQKYVIEVFENDKATLEQAALNAMIGVGVFTGKPLKTFKFGRSSSETRFDLPYLKSVYDFEYKLQKVEPVGWDEKTGEALSDPRTNKVLYKYIYEIIATLK